MPKPTPPVSDRGLWLIESPPLLRSLFAVKLLALVWLAARLWLGWMWIQSGSHKVLAPGWTQGGAALQDYWARALGTTPAGKPVITVDWYRGFIQTLYDHEAWSWFAPLIAWGELLVGVALVLGLFTGLAAVGSCLMNWSYAMAGSTSTNMLMFSVAIPLVLAWKTAGWFGLDRLVLRWLALRVTYLFRRDTPDAGERGVLYGGR
jgi:thiosulfate dehydrogenase (quinone) large subunit